MFMTFYFVMTMIHAIHMTAGAAILGAVAWIAHKKQFSKEWFTPVDMTGLYLHFRRGVGLFVPNAVSGQPVRASLG